MISSEILKNAIIAGAANIQKHTGEVNEINVFPVPDGDTGTNLALTLSGCAKAIADCSDIGAGELADKAAGALFRCARGNSGVIFSLIFKGFAQSVQGLDYIDANALAKALEAGCDEAYAAIEKPTEGTMLTVIRLAASKAKSAAASGKNAEQTFKAALLGARASLKSTPNLLPALKKHGVVDAGGQGLIYIMEGMLGAGTESKVFDTQPMSVKPHSDNIEFTYCTEFLINTQNSCNIDSLRRYFSGIGDCSAVAEHKEIIKIHVHTNSPDKALAKGLELGELTDIKIDNMKEQYAKRS